MKVKVLGNVQDGGVPHLGCSCDVCEKAREDPREQKHVASLLLKENNEKDTIRYLIDATPDIRFQITGDYLDGVFISHANLGHLNGTLYFGEEGIDADRVSIYCNEGVENYMMNNDPFRMLVDRQNIEIRNFENGDSEDLQGGEITVENHEHPQVNHDTTSYWIQGEKKTLYYISDITEFNREILESIQKADIAIIDGTFYTENEIDRFEEVPHPPIKQTIKKTSDFDTEIHFTHLNHTNPALREDSEERISIEEQGYGVVEQGQVFEI